MRARIFRKLLHSWERQTPSWLIRLQIQILLSATARAFDAPGKRIRSLPPGQALREYAAFTSNCMKSRRADSRRLYRNAYALGNCLRLITGFTDSGDLRRLVFFLYRNLRIAMRGEIPGGLTVTECYFSRFYTPEECAMMSNFDAGFIAGIFGGGALTFTRRITEGYGNCKARFTGRDCL